MLIRRIAFEHVKLLPLKWPQNKVASIIVICKLQVFWDKYTDFGDEPVVQCDVPVVKHTSLDDGNNDDCK